MTISPQSISVNNIYQTQAMVGPRLGYIKVYMADTTLTNTANAYTTNGGTIGILDNLFQQICLLTEPFIVGQPYTSGTGSAILFVVRYDMINAASIQTYVQAIAGLSSATVTFNQHLVG